MIYSDFLMIGAQGFLTPLFPIFVTQQIPGASLETVGFSVTLFWVIKSLVQLPLARYIDGHRGERDDFFFMFLGSVLFALTPLLLLRANAPWHIYGIQALLGVWAAFVFPTYSAIFTRHIDEHREGFEWSLHSLAVGLGYGGAAGLAGWLGDHFGFLPLIVLNSLIMVSGALLLLLVKHEVCRDGKSRNPKAREPDRNGRRVA